MAIAARDLLRAGACLALATRLVAVAHELPGRPVQDFVAPAPGSYVLNAIQPAPDGRVLDSGGAPRRLAPFVTGAITLLSFVYTYCTDPLGCPLAYDTFVQLRERVMADPALQGRLRFVFLSFDPANDTPAAMRLYGGRLAARDGPLPWHFLTTRSVADLMPILEGFGQDVVVDLDASGRSTRTYSHMLKVFLIDRRGLVREIYTTAYLLPEVMLNDARSLILEEDALRPKWVRP
jgi:cytochrome oxidase Cu insertion factor (SCO1/SenC/PrrC family)